MAFSGLSFGQGLRYERLTVSDGRTFEKASITKKEPDGVVLVHDGGVTKIPFELIPYKIVVELGGFDPRAAEEFRQNENKTTYKYVIVGDGNVAMAVKSDLPLDEFREKIRKQSKKTHPKGRDTVWVWGPTEFINPRVMTPEGFADDCPALL